MRKISDRKADEQIVNLVINDFVDESVSLPISTHVHFAKNLDGFAKKLSKEFEQKINMIEGVYSSFVWIKLYEESMFDNSDNKSYANVDIRVCKNFDKSKIEHYVKTLLNASILSISPKNINIEFESENCN